MCRLCLIDFQQNKERVEKVIISHCAMESLADFTAKKCIRKNNIFVRNDKVQNSAVFCSSVRNLPEFVCFYFGSETEKYKCGFAFLRKYGL